MLKISRMRVGLAAGALLLLAAFGIWVLLHPASVWVQPWRAGTSAVQGNVMFGPYPTADDFEALRANGVTTVVSLLNPAVPYEKVLLAQERENAARHGMEVLNFPMGSILGQKFGGDYERNSRAAAEAAVGSRGVAYIHCYLGLHRARNVQRQLAALGATAANGRTDARARAFLAYDAGRHEEALQWLARMPERDLHALRIEAWSNFRLNRVAQARALFGRILTRSPDDVDATTGLGYCALRDNDLGRAERHFAVGLARGDVAAVEGMGYVKFRQGQRDDARAMFEHALAANPGSAELRAALERLGPAPAGAATVEASL